MQVLQSLLGFGDMCNRTRIPVYSSKSTAGSSVLNAIHWMQEVRSGEFQQMDWGEALNQAKYGQIAPPLYDPRAYTTLHSFVLLLLCSSSNSTNALFGCSYDLDCSIVRN